MPFNIQTGYEIEFLINIILTVIIGFIIGLERRSRGKTAGISTQAFVICGAMIFTFISRILDPALPTTIATSVVIGVGFLSAGIIMKQEISGRIKNLTTAVMTWFSAAIGMAIGFNLYFIAALATIFVIVVSRIPKGNSDSGVEEKMNQKLY